MVAARSCGCTGRKKQDNGSLSAGAGTPAYEKRGRARSLTRANTRCCPVGAVELPPLTQFQDYFVAPVES